MGVGRWVVNTKINQAPAFEVGGYGGPRKQPAAVRFEKWRRPQVKSDPETNPKARSLLLCFCESAEQK